VVWEPATGRTKTLLGVSALAPATGAASFFVAERSPNSARWADVRIMDADTKREWRVKDRKLDEVICARGEYVLYVKSDSSNSASLWLAKVKRADTEQKRDGRVFP
jgi:hypothetical protein